MLERLAGTPVPAPELVAADPDAAACDVAGAAHHARAGRGLPGAPPVGPLAGGAGRDPRRRSRRRPAVPPLPRARPPGRADVGRRPRACGSARSRWPTPRRPTCPSASSTATSIRATRCGRAPSSPAWSTGPPARAARRRSTSATCAGTCALDYGQRVADAVLPHPEHDPYYDVVTRARRPARARHERSRTRSCCASRSTWPARSTPRQ